jgi:hypothetical protein
MDLIAHHPQRACWLRQSFGGTAKHVIWDDQGPSADVNTEQLYRTIAPKDIMLVSRSCTGSSRRH